MAVIQSEFTFSSSPKWKGIFEAAETGRNGSSVTFKIVAKLKLDGTSSSTFYGYAVNWRATLNGVSSGLLKVKDASPRWYGGEAYRTFETTLTASVGASGGTIPLKIEVLASGGGSVSLNKTYNVSYSTWNTPPSMSGSLGVSPSGTISENTGSINVSWNKASDSNNNLSGYELKRYVNGSHNATFSPSASATSYSDNISGFGQGTKIYYTIRAKDSYNEWSNTLTSATVTKNTLKGATLSLSGSIGYDTQTISASFSGASNTNGNTTFKYKLYSDHIKVYNHDKITGTPFTITVVRDGQTAPSTPYILFNDVKNFAKGGSNWTRTATFMLETANSYGSLAHSNSNINVNIQTTPQAPTSVTVTGKTALSDNRSYYISGRSTMAVAWSGASDKLGGSLKYDVQTKVGTGSFTTVRSDLTTTNTTVSIPNVSAESDFYIRVIAKTTFGSSAYKDAQMEKIHYYNSPTVEFRNMNRTAEGVSVDIITQPNTSIPSVGWTKRSYSGLVSGSLTTSPQTISKTGLDSGTAYTLNVTAKDNTGLSAEVNKSVSIPVYTPILSVREKGVGVNAIPDGSAKLVVNGGTKITGGLIVDGKKITGDIDTSNLLKKSDLASTSNYKGKVANIGNDGVMEIGKYIDFHDGSTNDYDFRLTCSGNTLSGSGNLSIGGDVTTGGKLDLKGYAQLPPNGGSWINGATNGNIRGYRQSTGSYHPIISQTTSSNHKISLGGLGDDFGFHLYDANRTTNGIDKYWRYNLAEKKVDTDMRLTIYDNWLYTTGNNGWYNSTHAGGWFMQDSTWVRSYNDKNIYTGGRIKANTALETRYIDSTGGNLDINAKGNTLFINANAESGANLNINRTWSGSQGTEISIYNSKGKGWGYLGNSDYSFYRVYGLGGSVSKRETKYDIQKFDNEQLYNFVKDLNTYGYRTISDAKDEDGNITDVLKRQDMQLGCMIDELPTEVVLRDLEGGDGGAVDNYAYTTMVLGATKHLQDKIEKLEAENDKKDQQIENLLNRLEKMEELVNGIIEGRL